MKKVHWGKVYNHIISHSKLPTHIPNKKELHITAPRWWLLSYPAKSLMYIYLFFIKKKMEDFHHICDQYNIHTIAFDDVTIDKHNWMIHASNQELTWWCKEHCYPLKLDLCVDFFLPFVKYLASTVNRITDETCLFNFVQSVERWHGSSFLFGICVESLV